MPEVVGCDHVQFYVANLISAAHELTTAFGFTQLSQGQEWPGRTARSVVLGQGRIVVALTEPLSTGIASEYLERHGDGVARIGLQCDDVRSVYSRAVRAGARSIEPPRRVGSSVSAAIGGVGDIVHTLVESSTSPTVLLPGIGDIPRRAVPSPTGLTRIDHFAVCLPRGDLSDAVRYYRDALDFEVIFAENIAVGAQAMNSTVVASPGRGVVLTLIEPAGVQRGQIDQFVAGNEGVGVQHIAYLTEDIDTTVSVLGARGVRFAPTPRSYYAALGDRVDTNRHRIERLGELGILADRDHDGELYQIFTRSTHERSTYFAELIERDGATSFGSNNVRALFEAKQRDLEAGLAAGR